MNQLAEFAKTHAKAIVAFVVTVVSAAIAQGLITGQASAWVLIIVGAISAGAVHVTPNKPAP